MQGGKAWVRRAYSGALNGLMNGVVSVLWKSAIGFLDSSVPIHYVCSGGRFFSREACPILWISFLFFCRKSDFPGSKILNAPSESEQRRELWLQNAGVQ
jgi:hypothetical protein